MTTTVTGRNMVSIPKAVADRLEIGPGCKLEWEIGPGDNTLVVHVVHGRGRRARNLMGSGAHLAPGVQSSADALVAERELDSAADG